MGVVWSDNKKLEVEVNGEEVEELAMALDPRGKAFFKQWVENETKSHQEYDRGEKSPISSLSINAHECLLQKKRSRV